MAGGVLASGRGRRVLGGLLSGDPDEDLTPDWSPGEFHEPYGIPLPWWRLFPQPHPWPDFPRTKDPAGFVDEPAQRNPA